MSVSFDGDPTIDSFVREAAATSLISYPGRFSGTERYELVKKLGEGGFGVVFEVIDHRQGGRAALKILRQPYAERLYRFKREFRVLSEQTHPHLVRLYEMTASGRDLFFTMELIDGVPLLSWVARTPERAREAVRQLATGLAALHAAKLLHRDVKPSNVMVERGGRVVLLDFGLAAELDSGDSSELAGTPLYMSPEQCAEEPLSEASDWYAVGLLLYEALTGRLPFEGGLQKLLDAKQRLEAPPPSHFAPDVPEDLDRLCIELLRRDPAARPGADEVLRRLAAAPAPARVESAPFVGRAAELSALHAEAAAGGCRVVLARGPSGIGKSALLRRFLDELRLRRPETVILSGRCYERESVPYKALDAVLDALARHLKRLPAVEAAALLPRDVAALERLFPVLRQVGVFHQQAGAGADGLDPADLRRRGVAALRELLARLGDRRPVVVCIDDLQWGDSDSASLLADLVAGPDAPALLWVASFRQEEATTSPLLQKLTVLRQSALRDVQVRELALAPLDGDESCQLAAALLAEAHGDATRAAVIAGESGGSPFFLGELARGGAGELGELVLRRTRALPAAARELLEVIAVAARPVDVAHIVTVANGLGGAGEDARDSLARLRAEHLIRGREGERVECYHDRIREPVARAVEPQRLRAIHLALATVLAGHADPAQIAEHWAEGGDLSRAREWMVRACEAATAALAFDEALRLYRRALQLAGDARDLALELAAAEAASAAGHGVEAAQLWLGALDRAGERRFDLQRRAAEELILCGRLDEGWAAMSEVLAHVGISLPRTTGRAIARVLWGRAQRALFGRRFRPASQPLEARLRARLDAITGIELAAWMVDPVRAAAIQAQYLPLALKSGDREHAAAALLMEALASSSDGTRTHAQTRALLDEARALAQHVGGRGVVSVVALTEGTVAMMEGCFSDAHTMLERAGELAAADATWPGHASIRMMLSMVQLINLFWLGRAGEALARVPAELLRAEERGNLTGWAWIKVIEGWALGCRGRVADALAVEDEVIARVPERGFELPRWYLDYGRIMHALEQGDGERAWSLVTAARRRDRFMISSQVQSLLALRVWAAAALARAAQQPSARTAMLAEVRQFVASVEKKGAPWTGGIARGLRAAALSIEGDRAGAQRLLDEAEPLLVAHHQELLLAAVRAAAGRGDGWIAAQGVSREALWAQLPGAW